MKNARIIVLLVICIAVIAGVVLVITRPPAMEVSPPTEDLAQVADQVGEEILTPATAEDTAVPANDSEETPTAAVLPPTPRAEMEGTDPATVVLASGDVQLVEIFAFW